MSGNTNTDIWIAGAFAAFSIDLLIFPLDTLKTRIQSPDYKKLYINEGTNTVKKAALFRGLYQGLGSVILATLPSSGAFFTTYEGCKSIISRYNPPDVLTSSDRGLLPQPIIYSAASAIAELVSCAILTPAEVIKQNAQMVSKEDTRSSSATAQTLKKFRSNPLGLWRGYAALAGRNLPHTAIQFPLFERFKEAIKSWRSRRLEGRPPENETLLEHGLVTASAAGVSGAIAAIVTTPIDVIKTRIMLEAAESSGAQSGSKAVEAMKEGKVVDALGSLAEKTLRHKPKSGLAVAREVVQDQGWKGLMRGGALRGVWTMLGAGLYLGLYESAKLYLERQREKKAEE